MRGIIAYQTMKRNLCIYLFLGLGQILTGLLGSCFAFVVSGVLMLFKAVSSVTEKVKKPIKTMICVVFVLVCAFLMYYSFFMFVSEIDYASVRPQTWIAVPLAVTLIVLIAKFLSDRDALVSEEITDIFAAKSDLDRSIEDMTIFAIIFVGWLGTFVFDFYFEYAASSCVVICLVKNIHTYLSPTHTTPISEAPSSETKTHYNKGIGKCLKKILV